MKDDDLEIGQQVLVVIPPPDKPVQVSTIDGKLSLPDARFGIGRNVTWKANGVSTVYHLEAYGPWTMWWCTRKCLVPLDFVEIEILTDEEKEEQPA